MQSRLGTCDTAAGTNEWTDVAPAANVGPPRNWEANSSVAEREDARDPGVADVCATAPTTLGGEEGSDNTLAAPDTLVIPAADGAGVAGLVLAAVSLGVRRRLPPDDLFLDVPLGVRGGRGAGGPRGQSTSMCLPSQRRPRGPVRIPSQKLPQQRMVFPSLFVHCGGKSFLGSGREASIFRISST